MVRHTLPPFFQIKVIMKYCLHGICLWKGRKWDEIEKKTRKKGIIDKGKKRTIWSLHFSFFFFFLFISKTVGIESTSTTSLALLTKLRFLWNDEITGWQILSSFLLSPFSSFLVWKPLTHYIYIYMKKGKTRKGKEGTEGCDWRSHAATLWEVERPLPTGWQQDGFYPIKKN